jgi:SAM domain (Sterile alpha motif)
LADDVGQRANQDTVMDIAGWLRSLGLEKYEAVLRDNEIDDAVKLTEDHLRELGFPLGARLKLLDAIAV